MSCNEFEECCLKNDNYMEFRSIVLQSDISADQNYCINVQATLMPVKMLQCYLKVLLKLKTAEKKLYNRYVLAYD